VTGIKIIVCAKQIPDPEAPLGTAKIEPDGKRMDVSALRPVINPYDENAIEAALRIREEIDGEVTVLSLGHNLDASLLRKALAAGADHLILLDDSRLENIDTNSTACALSAAIRKIGEYDLVLAGRQAGDWDSGHTGIVLGEMLGVPTINLARGVRMENGHVLVSKICPGGYEEVRATLPAVVTVSNEVGGLRYPSMKMILLSRRKPVQTWSGDDVPINWDNIDKMGVMELLPPPDLSRKCEFMEGDSPEEKGRNLAMILKREFG
jgi:electron transfer flavoprotein beta subunit